MKKHIILALVAVLTLICSCKEEEKPLDIIGTWGITSIQTKSATLGGQTVDIYLTFKDDSTFELYQMIGQGRYSHFSGTWTLVETTLDGKYSDGTAWGSSYQIAQNEDRTTLTLSCTGEDYNYNRTSLPSDIESKLE